MEAVLQLEAEENIVPFTGVDGDVFFWSPESVTANTTSSDMEERMIDANSMENQNGAIAELEEKVKKTEPDGDTGNTADTGRVD